MVKGLVKLVVKDYNDYTSTNISNIQLLDKKGNNQLFSNLFTGKTVYLYVWKNEDNRPPDAQQKEYSELKERFAKYPDVVFTDLYIGSDTAANSYKLGNDDASEHFRKILNINNATPFVIGKNGSILAYKGPKPTDKVLVDYVLFQARNGEDGTKSAKRLIRGVSGEQRFKTVELKDWYIKHFNKSPDDLSFSVSSTQ